MPNTPLTLSSLSPGDSATVTDLRGVRGVARQRLLEMGVMHGARIRFVRRAPLGDPIEIHLKGYRLMLRESEASGISVLLEKAI